MTTNLRQRLFHPISVADPAIRRELLGLAGAAPRIQAPLVSAYLLDRAWPLSGNPRAAPGVEAAVGAPPEPIFIVGFWRSGTTLLHELMSRVPETVTCDNVDAFWPRSVTIPRGWKAGAFKRLAPRLRGFDKVALRPGGPQEEEFAIAQLGGPSAYLAAWFPSRRRALLDEALFFTGLRENAESLWRERYDGFIRDLAARKGSDRLLLKNPANSTRIALLSRMYPGARFVRLDRNRNDALRSFVKMFDHLTGMLALERSVASVTPAEAADLHDRFMGTFDDQWRTLPESQKMRVAYEDFVKDPPRIVRDIHQGLSLPYDAVAESRVGQFYRRRARHWSPAPVGKP